MSETMMNTTARDSSTALVLPKNSSRNVVARIEQAKNSLADLATVYLITEAAGQSQETLEAKRRDLQRFLAFYQEFHRHDRPDEWYVSITKAFLKHLPGARLAQASLGRIYATVRHFAREASGHQSDRYIWRYVKPDQQTLAEAIDELE